MIDEKKLVEDLVAIKIRSGYPEVVMKKQIIEIIRQQPRVYIKQLKAYKFEELKVGLWVWFEKDKSCHQITKVYITEKKKQKMVGLNSKYYSIVKFEENQVFPVYMANYKHFNQDKKMIDENVLIKALEIFPTKDENQTCFLQQIITIILSQRNFESCNAYTFEDLENDVWAWDSKMKVCFKVFRTYYNWVNYQYEIDILWGMTTGTKRFEEGRFFPVQKANDIENFNSAGGDIHV